MEDNFLLTPATENLQMYEKAKHTTHMLYEEFKSNKYGCLFDTRACYTVDNTYCRENSY